jgi:NADH-quinone oxidoreductase subunit N
MVASGLALAFGGGLGGTLLGGWGAAGALLGYPALAALAALAVALLLRPLGPAAAAAGALGAYQWELLAGLGLQRSGRWGAGPAALPAEALAPERPLLLALALLALLYGLFRSSGAAAADPRLGLLATLTLAVAAAADFLSLYLLLEAANLTLYWLLVRRWGAADGGGLRRLEPLLAYFLLNLLGSLLLLLGLALLYGATGAFGLGELALLAQPSGAGVALLAGGLPTLGSLCLLSGLLLKLGLAPFHGWVAPVYEALPAAVFVFLNLFPKGSLLLLLLRLGSALQWGEQRPLVALLLLLGSLNLAVGSLGALHQSSLRRLLIYSGLANLALPLYALALGGATPSGPGLAYLLLYLATTAALTLPLLAAGAGLGER